MKYSDFAQWFSRYFGFRPLLLSVMHRFTTRDENHNCVAIESSQGKWTWTHLFVGR
jgi:hypothetical protein